VSVVLLELYPQHLAVNGDMGNALVLERRMALAGLEVERVPHDPGADLPARVDLVTIGTGPDSAVRAIGDDLARIAPTLRAWADDGVPMLAVTAGMHVLGGVVRLAGGGEVRGAGVLEIEVDPRAERALTHQFVVDTPGGRFVGVENHGGVITGSAAPFGRVVRGVGNGDGASEGATASRVIGTHLHGPVLAMNPALADTMIRDAVERAGGVYTTGDDHERIDGIARRTRHHLARAVGLPVDAPA